MPSAKESVGSPASASAAATGSPCRHATHLLQRLFHGRSFVFSGETKKIAYAHHLDGQEVIPIQAVTALLLTGAGLLGCYGFLKGLHFTTFAGLLAVTQAWRALSELLRADYRGTGRITAYQVMALLSIVYAFLLLALFPTARDGMPDLRAGLLSLWDPAVLLFFEILWVVAFIHTGRSRVTGATIHLHVVKEKI